MTFEDQMRDIMKRHNLTALSVNFSAGLADGQGVYAYAHGDGHCGSTSGYDGIAAADAIASAIANLDARRNSAEPLATIDGLAA